MDALVTLLQVKLVVKPQMDALVIHYFICGCNLSQLSQDVS